METRTHREPRQAPHFSLQKAAPDSLIYVRRSERALFACRGVPTVQGVAPDPFWEAEAKVIVPRSAIRRTEIGWPRHA